MLNGIEFQTVGAAYLKALRPSVYSALETCMTMRYINLHLPLPLPSLKYQ